MARELKPLDISDVPELRALVEELRRSAEPRVLRADSEDVAILTPVTAVSWPRRRATPKTAADEAAFRSAFGGFKDLLDPETFKQQVLDARGSDRPLVRL